MNNLEGKLVNVGRMTKNKAVPCFIRKFTVESYLQHYENLKLKGFDSEVASIAAYKNTRKDFLDMVKVYKECKSNPMFYLNTGSL